MSTIRDGAYPGQRVIVLEGAHNFRDMGGYPTEDGRSVKYGLFFRSDELGALTEQDLEFLKTLKVRTILDYRSESEAERSPTPTLAGVDYYRLEASPIAPATSGRAEDYLISGALNRNTMIDMYAKLPFANPAYQFLIGAMGNPEQHGIIHHCAGGKDRTGVGALLILKLLGVPDAVVMEDYLLTNETLGPKMKLMLERLSEKLDSQQVQNLQAVFSAEADYLQSAITAVIEKYGNWDVYFEKEYGITSEKRSKIQEYCLI
ncbi:tyrosine-protein phosphatase [Paenibacillus filicis]|uniref:Tyrosine-protein phosphatase n=1 Tax=Paenibacillus gyeongsangnamensis TaxID=3388067 RepID=A0ABT4QF37_9BACL|nr:tyrosine-protein phosphatase [Paenibacillus filicis]MCZ8515493.1 tyrosine-protein phosphatase [Paenibacillus filicis]